MSSSKASHHLPKQRRAKTKAATKESVKADFFRRLARGEAIDMAASKAGLNDSALITDYVAEFHEADALTGQHEIEAITKALSTLKELCDSGGEEDKIRCDAAKALLGYVKSGQRNRRVEHVETKTSVSVEGKDLWDFTGS